MKTLRDLFNHQLKDLYSAEKQLKESMPKVIEAASNERLKNTLRSHLKETENHYSAVRQICDDLDINPGNLVCDAMKGLVSECEHMAKHDAVEDVKDAGIIACVQRAEHYEISAYGTAVRFARELEMSDVADKLQTILDQEYKADQSLDDLATSRINAEAKA